MRVFMAIKIAKRALGRNLMRSLLTMLGVIIGVGAVIAMVAIGQGAHASIRALARVVAPPCGPRM